MHDSTTCVAARVCYRKPPQPDAAQRFAEVKAAYQTLTDPAARTAYDNAKQVRGQCISVARACTV